MKIAVITTDGGAGKTAIAFAIAKELKHFLISNDNSIITLVYPEMSQITKEMPLIDDVVYDFGGFFDSGVIKTIKHCDIVLVPCINDLNSKMKAITTIKELSQYNKNFLVIATRVENKVDSKEIQEALNGEFPDIKVLPLRKTKILKNGLELGKSPRELVKENKQIAYSARSFMPEYTAILETILGVK